MLKQFYIVNSDFCMGKGKMSAQVAHGAILYMEHINETRWALNTFNTSGHKNVDGLMEIIKRHNAWRNEPTGAMKKIVVKTTEHEMNQFVKDWQDAMWLAIVRDAGLTQVPSESMTCIVIEPLSEELCQKLFGCMKLA